MKFRTFCSSGVFLGKINDVPQHCLCSLVGFVIKHLFKSARYFEFIDKVEVEKHLNEHFVHFDLNSGGVFKHMNAGAHFKNSVFQRHFSFVHLFFPYVVGACVEAATSAHTKFCRLVGLLSTYGGVR